MTNEDRWSAFSALAYLAGRCPGFAMCRTDFLGTGICRGAREKTYAGFFPYGRMRVIKALHERRIALTPAALEIAGSCTGCGICNKQCHFTAELQPMPLFLAFKELAAAEAASVRPPETDPVLQELEATVGPGWATNDPAHRAAYTGTRSPALDDTMPGYIALPRTTSEVSALVRTCKRLQLPFVARGSGTSLNGAVTTGLVIDMARMNHVEIDDANWVARIGPGVLAFDLQKRAQAHNLRANVAEPAACVCANILTTNMHSLFSYAYGLGADHVVDAEFVDDDGMISTTSQKDGPNPFQFRADGTRTATGVCTGASVRLFPRSEQEEASLVPCAELSEAVELARTLAERRIGVALGVLGATYMSLFAGHTADASRKIRALLENQLGIRYFVLLVGHPSALAGVRDVATTVLDHETIVRLLRALPHLDSNPGLTTLLESDTGSTLFRTLFSESMRPLLTMTLDAGSADFEHIPESLRGFYQNLYRRPEMVDPVWLNTFRILPARMGRGRQFASQIAWVPLRTPAPAADFVARMSAVAERHGVEGEFGYLTPIDHGTRAVMEFDFYFDATDSSTKDRARVALRDAAAEVREMLRSGGVACTGGAIVGQGMARYQSYLFRAEETS